MVYALLTGSERFAAALGAASNATLTGTTPSSTAADRPIRARGGLVDDIGGTFHSGPVLTSRDPNGGLLPLSIVTVF